jgi:hypothetical protein
MNSKDTLRRDGPPDPAGSRDYEVSNDLASVEALKFTSDCSSKASGPDDFSVQELIDENVNLHFNAYELQK